MDFSLVFLHDESVGPSPPTFLGLTFSRKRTKMTATVESAMGRLSDQRDRIMAGQSRMAPGQPATFTHGCVPGVDMISQGDLDLMLEEGGPPKGFKLRKNGSGQLVPGTTAGSKHIVEDPSTCEIWDPPGWSQEYDQLVGPVVIAREATVIGHPTHGPVTVLPGQQVNCEYQRVFEHEVQKERRQRD